MGPSLVVLMAIALFYSIASAQAADASLDDILARLQANLEDYRSSIPSFYCSEHVVSRHRQYYSAEDKTAYDSVFRLDRRDPPLANVRLNLVEHHELKAVNRVPVRNDSLPPPGPVVVDGVFSNSVSIASKEMESCYTYTLRTGSSYDGHPAIEVEYRYKPEMAENKECHPARSSGRAVFDAATLHPLRIEMTAPHYEVSPGSRQFGLWRWRAEFVAVTLDGRQFWLPGKINSRVDSEDQTSTWYFEATYSNYHKLTVKSRIVTDVEGNPPPQP